MSSPAKLRQNVSVQSSSSEVNILDYMVDLRPYGMNSVLSEPFIFEVKACNQVYLSSSDTLNSAKPFDEITIGSHQNLGLLIRRRNDASLQPSSIVAQIFNTPNIVNCNNYRPFWITWEAENIMIGSGNVVKESVTASWIDQDPFIVKCFGVTTLADIVGHWKLFIPC